MKIDTSKFDKQVTDVIVEVTSFPNRSRPGRVRLMLPKEVLAPEVFEQNTEGVTHRTIPYGDVLTVKLAAAVFHDKWKEHVFGIVPINYIFHNGILVIDGKRNPIGTDGVLFYSNVSLKPYYGLNKLIGFSSSELNGVIIPFDNVKKILSTHESINDIQNGMWESLGEYFA